LLACLAFLLPEGCAIPSGTDITTRVAASSASGCSILERCTTKTGYIPFSPEGPQPAYPRSRIWSYWYNDRSGKLREIEFLRRSRIGYGILIYTVELDNQWIAIDVMENGHAKIILIKDLELRDQRGITFDCHGSEPFQIISDRPAFEYWEHGRQILLPIGHGKFLSALPNQSTDPTLASGTPGAEHHPRLP
jgi:hypothetical protein